MRITFSDVLLKPGLHIKSWIFVVLLTLAAGVLQILPRNQIGVFPAFALASAILAWYKGFIPAAIYSVLTFPLSLGIDILFPGGGQIGSLAGEIQSSAVLVLVSFLGSLASGNQSPRPAASLDPLTEVLKGEFFAQVLERELEKAGRAGKQYSFFVFDFDSFSQVNLDFGKPEGDLLLQTTAKSIRSHIRPHDVAARLDSNRFAILLPETAVREAEIQTEILLQLLMDIITIKKWPVSISSVLLAVNRPELDTKVLLETAARELSEIKSTSRGSKKILQL